MGQNDYQLALLLQQQFEHEANIDNPRQNLVYANAKNKSNHFRSDSKSLTDPSWELIDPTPDIHILFIAFNEKYFWNKLLAVTVDWSKRMTSCAGICSYQGRGGLCKITLSEPLLKLRPRKDLVETLLHEMIHAYLFVTHNNKDRDGHGPEFHKHMYRINAEAGTNITVYHTFHDEVRLYQQHWWRCDGPCQKLKPYFGMVRRATNRAPGPNDFWWTQHQATCGGNFIKVKEPEKPEKIKQNKSSKSNGDIRKFIPVLKDKNSFSSIPVISSSSNNNNNNNNNNASIAGPSKNIKGFKDLNTVKPKNALSNSSNTIVINKKPSTITKPPVSPEKSNLVQTKLTSVSVFSGKGQVLGNPQQSGKIDYETVRNHWINKFPLPPPSPQKNKRSSSNDSNFSTSSSKRIKANNVGNVENSGRVKCPVCEKIILETEMNLHLDVCLQNEVVTSSPKSSTSKCPICDKEIENLKLDEHVQTCINDVFNNSGEFTIDDFKPAQQELIPCLVCNKNIVKSELNVHLDDCMGDNIFNNSNPNCFIEEEDNPKIENEVKHYNCPVCFERYSIHDMSGHLDQCLLNDSVSSEGDSVSSSFLEDPF